MLISAPLVLAVLAQAQTQSQTPARKPATVKPAASTVGPAARLYEPKAGDTAALGVQSGATATGKERSFFLLTAPDKAAWDQYLALNRSRAPRAQYEAMAAEGRLFSESPGTRVRVVAPRPGEAVGGPGSSFYPVEVAILEGPREGQRGLISHRYLTPSPAPQAPAPRRNPGASVGANRHATPRPGSPDSTPPPDDLQARQQRYGEEILERQRYDQAMQDALGRLRQTQENLLHESLMRQQNRASQPYVLQNRQQLYEAGTDAGRGNDQALQNAFERLRQTQENQLHESMMRQQNANNRLLP